MKALWMAAALALPIAANANEPGSTGDRSGKSTKTSIPTQNPNQQYPDQPEAGMADPSQSGTLSGARSGSAIGSEELFSANKVVDKIHSVNKKHIEYGNLARTRASNDQVRKFGAKLVKDHQKLDDAVFTYAKQNKIQLSESDKEQLGRSQLGYGGDRADDMTIAGSSQGSTGSTGGSGTTYGTQQDSLAQAGRTTPPADVTGQSGAMGGTGADQSGTTGGSTQRANDVGRLPEQQATESGDRSGTASAEGKSPEQKRQEYQAKIDELKNLQGPEFDAAFLTNVIEASQSSLEKLQGWKGQGDKKLDLLIDKSVRMIGDHLKEAQRLQQKVPAA